MNKKGVSAVIGVILMVAITVVIAMTVYVYVSGMLDANKELCKDSYDNLKLNYGYNIYTHSSDFISGNENSYYVSYYIMQPNSTTSLWIHGFIYNANTDYLLYGGNSEYVKEIINPTEE